MPTTVGEVTALARFPVKSMLGEHPAALALDTRGVAGDRAWAVRTPDGKHGAGKNTPRFRAIPGLRRCRAAYEGAVPRITLSDGVDLRGDDPGVHEALTAELGTPVVLAQEEQVSLLDAGPGFVHILTTASVEYARKLLPESEVDEHRFRPNILLSVDGAPDPVEETWLGRTLTIGTARLRVSHPTERCAMVNHARHPHPHDPRVLRALTAANGMNLGVYAEVLTPGEVGAGDRAHLS